MFEKIIMLSDLTYLELTSTDKLAASLREDISQEIKDYASDLKPNADNIYVLATPLGASEYWGPNNNGDWFSEEALDPQDSKANWGHKSFELTPARIYRRHFNKDPELSVGKVVKSAYNKNMHRVEVIMEINKHKAPDVVQRIEQSEEKRAAGDQTQDNVGISMGCRLVDGDVCSICGNRAYSKMEYCEHLENNLGDTLPDGRKVVAHNPKPLFFDLSIVDNPAAGEAAILKKVASSLDKAIDTHTGPEIRTYYSEGDPEIRKVKSVIRTLSKSEPLIPTDTLHKIASETENFLSILDTFGGMGIVLKPEEFQYLVLTMGGHNKIAEQYSEHGIVFPTTTGVTPIPRHPDEFNSKIASLLSGYMDSRSGFTPFVDMRLLQKQANTNKTKNKSLDSPLLSKVSKLYNGYRDYGVRSTTIEKIASIVTTTPEVLKWYLDSSIPDVKLASLNLVTTHDVAKNMLGTIPHLYILLA